MMNTQLIDSHAHLTSQSVYPVVDALLGRARSAGIQAIVNICTDHDTLQRGLALAKRYPWVYNTAATTPHDVKEEGEVMFAEIEKAARDGLLVALGETGLDYHYFHSPLEKQQEFLRRYLRLALDCHLPVVIHCRDAFSDFFEILDQEYKINGEHGPGVLHCFTGTMEEAKEVVRRGWYLSLSGIVTFKKSEELRAVASMVPLDQLLIETDTPYLAPQSHRGKPNEPAFLFEVAQTIAVVKGLSVEKIIEETAKNAKKLFKITPPA
jgi:TatD DNase family protein